MKKIKFGNLINQPFGIIVHGCNAQGVMGSGFAKQLKDKYPSAFDDYYNQYKTDGLELGSIVKSKINENLWILHAITQQDYGRDKNVKYVNYQAVKYAFTTVKGFAQDLRLPVHYPLIGAGLANGEWAIISDVIESAFDGTLVEHNLWLQDTV